MRGAACDVPSLRASVDLQLIAADDLKLVPWGTLRIGLCPFHGERTPSLYVYPDHYHCFGCGAHGDAIQWLRVVRKLKFQEAVEYLGGDRDNDPFAGRRLKDESPRFANPKAKQGAADSLALAQQAWDRGIEPAGTVAERYLEGRGLDLPPEPVIRFLPRAGWWDAEQRHPELVIRIDDPLTGELIGVQTTPLRPDGADRVRDAKPPRLTWRYHGRAGFGKLYEAGPVLALAEGAENALAAAAIFGAPAWTTFGSENMAKAAPLPEIVRTVLIVADHDKAGLKAARAASQAYQDRGLAVIERLPRGAKDINEILIRRRNATA